jgi:hypothetical protein
MTTQISLEQLAEKLNGKLWVKGDLKRVYLERGHNTKKMSTKTYVYEINGEFKVSCYIDCPSQPFEWIKSQQEQIISRVLESIEQAQFEIENPEADYCEHKEQQEVKSAQIQEQKELSAKEKKAKTVSELTIENIGEYLNTLSYNERHNKQIWNVNFNFGQFQTQSRFLNEKDEYPAIIYTNRFERTFLKSEKNAHEVWTEAIGNIKVGETEVEFADEVEFVFVRKQGKNGPNKKNVFAPKEIPAHVTEKLNEVLVLEQAKRIEHLKQMVDSYRNDLIAAIEEYKNSFK